MRHHHTLRQLLAVLLSLITLALWAAPSVHGREVGTGNAVSAQTTPQLELKRCVVQNIPAECGSMTVYEDRVSQTGRTIRVFVVRVPARDKPQRLSDPLFIFAGGPGGAITDLTALYASIYAEVNQQRDLVFIDQRGVGKSNPLYCTIDPAISDEANGKACLATLDADPRFYTTAMYTDDVDDVRTALGYDQINIVGGSYGATVVQAYLIRHGDRVRVAIHEHGTLIDIPFYAVFARNSQLALDRLFARCERDSACSAAYPDLRAEWATLQARVTTEPVATAYLDPFTQKRLIYDQKALAKATHLFLFSTDTAMRLPAAIHDAYVSGDLSDFARIASDASRAANPGRQALMYMTIMCKEAWVGSTIPRDEVRRLGEGSYLLEATFDYLKPYGSVCPLLPDGIEPNIYPQTAKRDPTVAISQAPILFMVGEIDPQNPIENLEGVESLYPQARVIVEPGQAHAELKTPCRHALLNQFIIEPSKQPNISCLEERLPPFLVK